MPEPSAASPTAGLATPRDASHALVFFADNKTWGGYNHGPALTAVNGTFFASWYNGVMDEGDANRALFATSVDGERWSEPAVLFNTTAFIHPDSSSSSSGGGSSSRSGVGYPG